MATLLVIFGSPVPAWVHALLDAAGSRGVPGERYALVPVPAALPGNVSDMSGNVEAVVFDFEGTLVDFQWRLAQAEAELRHSFAAAGYAAAGNYAEMWNTAADLAAPQGRLAQLRGALCRVYDRWDADALTRWEPRPGAAELLSRLQRRGIGTAMVSNIGRAALAAALGRFGFERWLSPVVSRDEVTWMKPRTEGVRHVLATLGVAPSAALFVGDSRADVLAARAAGMRVAIIRGGECEEAAFDALPPDHLITQLDEVIFLVGRSASSSL
ncbi:MAG: HAD family hydrolase [Burkholderiaceae bacterium]|nr:HAD family hydrolase [Burkholderiaceae bacterium]